MPSLVSLEACVCIVMAIMSPKSPSAVSLLSFDRASLKILNNFLNKSTLKEYNGSVAYVRNCVLDQITKTPETRDSFNRVCLDGYVPAVRRALATPTKTAAEFDTCLV